MNENKLIFKLTEKTGNYGIIFQGSKPVAFAMFEEEDFSLAVAFKNGDRDNYSKGEIFLSVYKKTDVFYGMHDYRVTENDEIVNAHYERYTRLND